MFVIVEGPNGSGKTTLIKNLSSMGCKTLSSPNGTPLAKMIRPACRGADNWSDLDPKVKFMLFSAARYDEYVRIVHESNDIVVADRWWTSTYIYQCLLEGIDVEFLENTIHDDEKIDLVICLGGEKDILFERLKKEREKNPSHGFCSWTKERKKFDAIVDLYDKLSVYLFSKGINCINIDTTCNDQDEVLEIAWEEIKKVKFENEVYN